MSHAHASSKGRIRALEGVCVGGGGGGGGGVEICPAWKLLTLKLCVHNANNNAIYTARL